MKADKLRELDTKELDAQTQAMREQLFRLRFQMSMGQMEGLKKFRVLKKDMARLQGILREREVSAQKGL
jgi:large subunit ribosomal protein L29